MKKKSENHITHAHDKFIRTVMADPRVAREFFTIHLPEAVRDVTDLESLVLQPRSHIDDVRNETTVDILYKTTMACRSCNLNGAFVNGDHRHADLVGAKISAQQLMDVRSICDAILPDGTKGKCT